jgi:chromosomal replication initiator protein
MSIAAVSPWIECLRQLEAEVPEQLFNVWVRPLQAVEDGGVIRLLAPNRFVVEWVRQNLLERIGELLCTEVTGDAQAPQVLLEVGTRATGGPPAVAQASPVAGAAPGARAARAPPLFSGARVNPEFTFDSFVEGKSNQLAKAAARQVADNPGRAYNPLFVYGGVGLGKTHLMHAVANALRARRPQARISSATWYARSSTTRLPSSSSPIGRWTHC